MKGFIIGFFMATAFAGGAWLFTHGNESASTSPVVKKVEQKYHCPMHPTYVSDKPGDCPICGMKLVPIDQIAEPNAPADHSEHQKSVEATPEGYVPVTVSEDKVQLMGVTTTRVMEAELDQSIRTTGRIVADETRVHHVHAKFEGYIERIYVNYVGQSVKKGQPLFTIYSPELLATQREYLLALKAQRTLRSGGNNTFGDINLVEAARRRLALWDIGPGQIAQIEKSGEPVKALTVTSPVTGYVTAKTAIQGSRIMPSDSLYDIIDLSRVWVMADVYEVNLPFVKIGMPVTVELPYEANKIVSGKVTYIDPLLDPMTRTAKARIEMNNPGNMLKPEMYTKITFSGAAAKGLMVPESAVISTGERMIVFVAKGEGYFQPREVVAGSKVRGYYEIKSGLSAGELVVTSGNFLLDSESKMRAAISGTNPVHQH